MITPDLAESNYNINPLTVWLLDQRDEWYAYQLKRREDQCTDRMILNVHTVTYNLAGVAPKEWDDSDLIRLLAVPKPDAFPKVVYFFPESQTEIFE